MILFFIVQCGWKIVCMQWGDLQENHFVNRWVSRHQERLSSLGVNEPRFGKMRQMLLVSGSRETPWQWERRE